MLANLMPIRHLEGTTMTTRTMRSEAFPDPAATEASSRASSTEPSTWGALFRVLLAGAVALLVMLLPSQLAASRAEVVVATGAALLDAAPASAVARAAAETC
jgi:hypothetical protein